MENYVLRDGLVVPAVGFGTFRLKGAAGVNTLDAALACGYRLFDTAYNYENEGTLGMALKKSSVPRAEILIASKLPGRYQHYDDALTTIQESLYRTGLDYFDIYSIHWPNPQENLYVEAWQALLDAQKFGLIRSVAVCNFLPEHLERLEKETGVLPVINQIELHPYFNQATTRAYNREKNILTQAWSPLGRGSELMQNPVIVALAARLQKSPAQIILRWERQLGVLPIPKASHPERQKQNLDLFNFSLTADDMNQINALTKIDGRLKNQDPAVYQEF